MIIGRRLMKQDITFSGACALAETLLRGNARRELVLELSASPNLGTALTRLQDRMRANAFSADGRGINLEPFVAAFDGRTRREGFHVLHDWDGKADRVNEDIIPVDVLHFIADHRGGEPPDATTIAILVDYYFFHVLQLLSMRLWDDGDADENLDRLSDLLSALQGADGGGQRFVSDAETLLLIATSHYERVERAYGTLLDRVRALNEGHQIRIALGHAASMGGHLRFGFEATYARDTVRMRDDNIADYPWLCYALLTAMLEYARVREIAGPRRDAVVEAILNGLSPDAAAFIGPPPQILSSCDEDRARFRELFLAHKEELLAAFESLRPTERAYSPLSFFFNFSHNIIKGTVVDALLNGEPWNVTFNDLLSSVAPDPDEGASRKALAETLMGYARLNPDRIGGRLMPVIVYDPQAGRQAFAVAMRKMRE